MTSNEILGVGPDGQPITLSDIWPSDEEIDAVVASAVKPEQFTSVYEPMFIKLKDETSTIDPLYEWRPTSTYIRRPPLLGGALAGERTLRDMRPLAVLGDNITTDHLSPSNAILASSAAGEYLAKMGLPEEDFNSYATHRGDHLTAQRATFANPKLINEMAVVDGDIQQGSLARLEPEGEVIRMWEAIETYMGRAQPLIIIAGADYGQGSSRDWAAKGFDSQVLRPSSLKDLSAFIAPISLAWAFYRLNSREAKPATPIKSTAPRPLPLKVASHLERL